MLALLTKLSLIIERLLRRDFRGFEFNDANMALFLQRRSRMALKFVNAQSLAHVDGTIRGKYRDERNCSVELYPIVSTGSYQWGQLVHCINLRRIRHCFN